MYEILAGYADMGYSRTDVASILGVSRTALFKALRFIDPDKRIGWWPLGSFREVAA